MSQLGTLLDRVTSRFEAESIARSGWLADGVQGVLLLPLMVALPFAISGPLRAVLGWSLPVTLPLALLIAVVATWPIFAWWRARGFAPRPSLGIALPLFSALCSIAALYRREFAGLTNYAGGDGGVHLAIKDIFVNESPGSYQGFVSMYALMYWIEHIGRCNAFWSLCIVYYFGVAVVAAVPCIISIVALEPYRRHRAAFRAGVVACALSSIAIAFFIVLPQQHYHQTDGFFPHLFGLVPLMLLWLVDVVARARLWRWIGLVLTTVLYRYTYALNLGDVGIAVGVLLFFESFGPSVPRLLRWLFRLAPFVMAFGARTLLAELRPLFARYGWIVPYDVSTVLVGQALGCVALMLLVPLSRRGGAGGIGARLFRFPIVLATINGALALHIMRMPPREPYYFLKYPMHAVVLLAGAAIVAATLVVAATVALLAERRRVESLSALAATLLLASAIVQWRRAYDPYQPGFLERVFAKAPFTYNRPLADLGAWSRIERTLEREHARFGGYVTSYWPMFNFMNAGLGYYNGGRLFWERGGVKLDPGYCVFWDRGKVDWWTTPNDFTPPLRIIHESLEQNQDRTCVSYRAAWNHAVERTLCHVCVPQPAR